MPAAILDKRRPELRLPNEDELPCSDGEPMETFYHVLQMVLLLQTLEHAWAHRSDFFAGGNMFIYFSLDQIRRRRRFRGPDVFVVLGVSRRTEKVRKSWVVWDEGKAPNVVIEIISRRTKRVDQGEKKLIYQDEMQVPEYFWYDPSKRELVGFRLVEGTYLPIPVDETGLLPSRELGLALRPWDGRFQRYEGPWLRWFTLDGELLPTPEESAAAARQQAGAARQQAEDARQQVESARLQGQEEHERAERLAAKLRALGQDPEEA